VGSQQRFICCRAPWRVGARPPHFFSVPPRRSGFGVAGSLPTMLVHQNGKTIFETLALTEAAGAGLSGFPRIVPKKPSALGCLRRTRSHLWLRVSRFIFFRYRCSLAETRPIPVERISMPRDCKVTPAGCACQERNTTGCISNNDGLDAELRVRSGRFFHTGFADEHDGAKGSSRVWSGEGWEARGIRAGTVDGLCESVDFCGRVWRSAGSKISKRQSGKV
jgi:hypothetical protein